jgi:hypothetical protein
VSTRFRLAEPTTTLTDYAMAILSLAFAVRLFAQARILPARSIAVWASAFVATGIAALVGGTVHGFVSSLGPTTRRRMWRAIFVAIGAANALMVVAVVLGTLPPGPLRMSLSIATAAKLVYYLVRVLATVEYRWVVYDSAASLIVVASLEVYALLRWQTPSASWILGGVAVAIVAASIQGAKVSIHRHFNHNDLYHVVQMIALWLLYRGGMLFTDRL